MSQQDNFVGGFIAGAICGGVVGGVIGVLVASRLGENSTEEFSKLDDRTGRNRRPLKPPTEQSIELARRGLEDKIAQLNDAIDDVREQLGGVNGTRPTESDRIIARDS